jgi:hypothetical protein
MIVQRGKGIKDGTTRTHLCGRVQHVNGHWSCRQRHVLLAEVGNLVLHVVEAELRSSLIVEPALPITNPTLSLGTSTTIVCETPPAAGAPYPWE